MAENRAKEKSWQLRAQKPAAKLADAQLAVARDYGFPSWRKLKEQVDRLAANSSSNAPSVAIGEDSTKAVIDPIRHGRVDVLKRLLTENPGLAAIRVAR